MTSNEKRDRHARGSMLLRLTIALMLGPISYDLGCKLPVQGPSLDRSQAIRY